MEKEPFLVNNEVYDQLGEKWYTDPSHPIALLKVEARIKSEYILQKLGEQGVPVEAEILDIGCGAGFISNKIAGEGFGVRGVDLAEGALKVAESHAPKKGRAHYQRGDALALEFADDSFDVALLMDVLEHVPDPKKAIQEALRVLRPGGILFFHTFNRTPLAWLLAVKALDYFSDDKNMHLYRYFIKPSELESYCVEAGSTVSEMVGIRPQFGRGPFWKSLWRARVEPGFDFTYTSSLAVGYMGFAVKRC